jgi:hypothetical protein
MIDANQFRSTLEHAICEEQFIERSDCEAIKIDDSNGLATHLGFGESMLSKVDYCSFVEHKVQLIELTDLEQSIDSCKKTHKTLTAQAKAEKDKLTSKDHKRIRKQAWHIITDEFKRKWNGSIAVIERLYRKNAIMDDPDYCLLIVCKNKTDIKMLDELTTQLMGMTGSVCVCNTENVRNFLNS